MSEHIDTSTLPEPLKSQLENGDWTEKDDHESEFVEERLEAINMALGNAFPSTWAYVVVTNEEKLFVIADVDDSFYKINYSYNEDIGYAFSDPVQWQRVERKTEWVELSAKARLAHALRVEVAMIEVTKSGDEYRTYRPKTDEEIQFDLDTCPKKMIKVLKSDDDTLTIGAYATIWGELDCDGERMQKEALEPYVESNATPYMFWLHGWDSSFGSTIIGEWNKDSFVVDDIGLRVEGTVTHPEAIRRLKESGGFGLSVGSNPQYVQIDGLGNITDWALLEISVMEGGKQCVPNARQEIDKTDNQYDKLLATKAAEFGEQEAPEPTVVRYYRIGGELIRAN